MARAASGRELLDKAKMCMAKARTAEELRQAQAVVFPLEHGFSMEQTAKMLGVSRGWACRLRRQFIVSGGAGMGERDRRGGRRRANMSGEAELEFLAPFLEKAVNGGILIVGEIKQELDKHLGRAVALASVYNLLHRHGWRKLAPDKRHPKANIGDQEEWKKNSRNSSAKPNKSGRGKAQSG